MIVGRCADYILRARADCLTVFIHADKEIRDERIAKEYGVPEDSVVRRRKEKDKRRAAYYQFFWHSCIDIISVQLIKKQASKRSLFFYAHFSFLNRFRSLFFCPFAAEGCPLFYISACN